MNQKTFTELIESYNDALAANGASVTGRIGKLQRCAVIIRRYEAVGKDKFDDGIIADYIREIGDRFNDGKIGEDHANAMRRETELSSSLGLRDRTMLILLYDSAARVSELVGIKLKDLRFGKTPTIILHGKNGKIRTVPLSGRTMQYLKKYLLKFHADVPLSSGAPLFYSVMHGEQYPLSDRCVRYLLRDYADKAWAFFLGVPKYAHPHQFRHSRSMHLYQNGMDLTLISQWLGHAHLETTQIYAHADTEHKRTAIAKATPENLLLFSKLNPERYTITDEDALKRLVGLRK